MSKVIRTPVLIVGAGPVGLALAADLGWRNTECLLIEKTDGAISQPKMDMVGVRTMEFARRWGIVEWIERSPYPRDYPQDNVYLESLTGFEFGREVVPSKQDELVPSQSPQKRERCPQDMFDPILRRLVAEFSGVSLKYRHELAEFHQTPHKVYATVRDLESGSNYEVESDYLVGTDGGASKVRESLGIAMQGTPVLTYTTNVIFRCDDLPSLHDKKKAYRFIFIGPEGTWLTIVAINGRDRWRMSIVGDQDKRTFSEADIRAMIVRAMGKQFDFKIESIVPWVRRELLADSYGTNRTFIAGDAAHLMSPTGGFGMNTGIGDSIDLAWKLDAALKGWGTSGLLKSYELERKPVAERNIAESSANLRAMLTPRSTPPPEHIFKPGAEHNAARDAYGKWYGDMMKREWYTIGIHLGYVYNDSPINVMDGTPPPPSLVATYQQTARPGSRAPHIWLKDGRSTLDLFGRGFVLLRLGSHAPAGTALSAAGSKVGMEIRIESIVDPAVLDAYERALVLVRPDGHVAWRSDNEPENAELIIDTVRGAKVNGTPAPSMDAPA